MPLSSSRELVLAVVVVVAVTAAVLLSQYHAPATTAVPTAELVAWVGAAQADLRALAPARGPERLLHATSALLRLADACQCAPVASLSAWTRVDVAVLLRRAKAGFVAAASDAGVPDAPAHLMRLLAPR